MHILAGRAMHQPTPSSAENIGFEKLFETKVLEQTTFNIILKPPT